MVLHTDHCAKKLLPWLDGLLDADEAHFKAHGEPLFSSHMIDLSEEDKETNISTTAKYLQRAAPMKQWLEMVCMPRFPAGRSPAVLRCCRFSSSGRMPPTASLTAA